MKTEIEQYDSSKIEIQPYGNDFILVMQGEDTVSVSLKSAREVALAICPELSQPEDKQLAKKYFLLGAKIADETSKTNHIAKDFETHFELIFQPEINESSIIDFDDANYFYRLGRFETKEGQFEKHYKKYLSVIAELKAVKTADTKPSDKFIAFVKRKYEQKDHNTMYLFDNMIDAIYQGVLCQLINECFEPKEEQPEKIVSELPTLDEFTKVVMRERDWQLEVVVPDLEKQVEELKSEVEKAKELLNVARHGFHKHSHDYERITDFLEGTKTK